MDTQLRNGDHCLDGSGLPATLTGAGEVVQQALIRLGVRRGSFALDPGLGGELYRLGRAPAGTRERLAMSYVREALAGMSGVGVRAVSCIPRAGDGLLVQVELEWAEREYRLQVEVDG